MTDSEKLDLILEKVSILDEKVTGLEKDINSVKRQIMKSTAELKAMDEIILDEVERVHGILDKHKKDKSVHTA
jgi:septal ring factor EnvC (AmiA/AmiB activator)